MITTVKVISRVAFYTTAFVVGGIIKLNNGKTNKGSGNPGLLRFALVLRRLAAS